MSDRIGIKTIEKYGMATVRQTGERVQISCRYGDKTFVVFENGRRTWVPHKDLDCDE